MYYCVDMYDGALHFIQGIDGDTCAQIHQAAQDTREVLHFYALGKDILDAILALDTWSRTASTDGNHLMRNLHTAEELVRGFLFAFRTCLDHMETEIKQKHGEHSPLWQLFQAGVHHAYDTCPEYAFTYHLRNCAQHCKNVVHGFSHGQGLGIVSNTRRLRAEYTKWNSVDKAFMASAGDTLNLLDIFSKAFSAFNDALRPVMQQLLDTNQAGSGVIYLRQWGDRLSSLYQHEVHCFHIVSLEFPDGREATREDMAGNDIRVNAYPMDWDRIYALSDSIQVKKKSAT